MRENPNRVVVRRLSTRDGPDLVRASPLFDHPVDPDAAAAFLSDPSHHVWLADMEGGSVGYLTALEVRQLHTTEPQMFLYEVAVDEGHRRHGIGRRLVEALLDYCRYRGIREAFVITDDPANVAAHRLYESTGAAIETAGERMYVYRLAPVDASDPA